MIKRLPSWAAIVFLGVLGVTPLVSGVNRLGASEVMCHDRVMQPDRVCITVSIKGSGDALRTYDEQRSHNRWSGFGSVILGFVLLGITLPLITAEVERRPDDGP